MKRSNEMSSLAVLLFSIMDMIEGRVDAVATSGVHWGA
jgi:hypothetical protein